MAKSEVRGNSPEQISTPDIASALCAGRRHRDGECGDLDSRSRAGKWSADSNRAAIPGTSAGQLTYASARPLFTFDPRLVQTTEEMGLMQHVCEPLVRWTRR